MWGTGIDNIVKKEDPFSEAIKHFGKRRIELPPEQKDYIENYLVKDIEDILKDTSRSKELYGAYVQLTIRLTRLYKTKIPIGGKVFYYDTSKYDTMALVDILPKIEPYKVRCGELQNKG